MAIGLCLWAGRLLATAAVDVVPGMPPVVDPANLYSEAAAGHLSAAVADALPRIYVPSLGSNDVYVIDPSTLKVVDRFPVGPEPQHIVPSWDLKTLWVNNNGRHGTEGSLTPIDPKTGKPGLAIPVEDPYNLYFTADGRSAIVVAERLKQLDFRDPQEMALQQSLPTPLCSGVNHADFAIDGKYAIFTCEFRGGGLIKVDMVNRRIVGHLKLSRGSFAENRPASEAGPADAAFCGNEMPQDIRISPDGKVFYVADMLADGVFLVDGDQFKQIGFIPTGIGAHGLYPSRDGTRLYVTNRGSHTPRGRWRGPGSVSVIDFATREVVANWPIPGGGSPDMGNLSADGKVLWLSGRYDGVVYAINTESGAVTNIPVGVEPHGLTVWPQPGRYSLGHTGNMR
ncbi:MAG TPA: YncE family protein [Stellaceae bacterium]|nr:YncE family protein [Stellaceae bacterium]